MPMRMTIDTFKNKSRTYHNSKYDYSKVEYINSKTKVCIICPHHGDFSQTPMAHLRGQGCPKCAIAIQSKIRNNKAKYKFITNSNNTHDHVYDYSLVNYEHCKVKVIITCPIHGNFLQRPNDHLSGYGCPKCGGTYNYNTTEWINKANAVHNGVYTYSQVKYINNKTEVLITCNSHGDFKQNPYHHLSGQGCPKCISSNGEKMIRRYLEKNDIVYESQKRYGNCRNKKTLPFDFFIPTKNLLIEYDGEQHYNSIEYFGGINGFRNRVKHDNIKTQYALNNNITLLRIPYYNFDNINLILNNTFMEDSYELR